MVSLLPDDSLAHIFTFLPVQHIPRLASVCRNWCRVITQDTMICALLFRHYFPNLTPGSDVAADYKREHKIYNNIKIWHPKAKTPPCVIDGVKLVHGGHLLLENRTIVNKQGELIARIKSSLDGSCFSFHHRILINSYYLDRVIILGESYQEELPLQNRCILAVTEDECILWDSKNKKVEYRNTQLEVIEKKIKLTNEEMPIAVQDGFFYYKSDLQVVRVCSSTGEMCATYRCPGALLRNVNVYIKNNFVYIVDRYRETTYIFNFEGIMLCSRCGLLGGFHEGGFYAVKKLEIVSCDFQGKIKKIFKCTPEIEGCFITHVHLFNRVMIAKCLGHTYIFDTETGELLKHNSPPYTFLWEHNNVFYLKNGKRTLTLDFSA